MIHIPISQIQSLGISFLSVIVQCYRYWRIIKISVTFRNRMILKRWKMHCLFRIYCIAINDLMYVNAFPATDSNQIVCREFSKWMKLIENDYIHQKCERKLFGFYYSRFHFFLILIFWFLLGVEWFFELITFKWILALSEFNKFHTWKSD